ncbi:sensor domain-containing diguanylate cyclase [Synechococcus sp. CBW1002]|uniref:GGDEF domain-containing protein n=1 Tax=Synechococcus sp. CBW1002 TaxID=1353134 RepID=UPI0018CEAADE|nr:sensor domain-containing diguanylate cyclase [Synechococcus sp. CBW1002]QPN59677.1 sensor domain-containing diguanylate cyclase [Synechococcus sp. CBW1002]
MTSAALPADEALRLEVLQRSALLDGPNEERFDRLTRLARRLFDVPIALVTLVDANRQWFKSCMGLNTTETPRDVAFCAHAILEDHIFLIPDARADQRFAHNPLVTGEPNICFYAGRPLKDLQGFALGTLCLIDQKPRELCDDDLATLEDLAQIAESELAGFQLSITDELTGITNRRGFLNLAAYGLTLCQRQKLPATLVFFDLDGLKAINDTRGHAAGDGLIRQFASLLAVAFRSSDLVARLGGDEFVALLVNVTVSDARRAVAALELAAIQEKQKPENTWDLQFSCGVVAFDPSRHGSISDLIEEGDALMYQAKRKKS